MAVRSLPDLGLRVPTPLERLDDPALVDADVTLLVKRDDLIHDRLPGNKARKLKYNLAAARESGHDTLLTFGGAFSNHIYAVAGAGQIAGFRTIGVVRGEQHRPLNPVLRYATECGMEIAYMDRETYRHKDDPEVLERLTERFGRFYLLPEGGSNGDGVLGCAETVAEIEEPFDLLCVSCGTGGTLAGLIAGLPGHAQAVGVAALKGGQFLNDDVRGYLADAEVEDRGNWRIELDYHFGGFARVTPELLRFIDEFEARHKFALDPVYTGKTFYAVFDLVSRGVISGGQTIVVVHTGGAPAENTAGLRR